MKKNEKHQHESSKFEKNFISEKDLKNVPGGETEISEINSFNKNKWHLHN